MQLETLVYAKIWNFPTVFVSRGEVLVSLFCDQTSQSAFWSHGEVCFSEFLAAQYEPLAPADEGVSVESLRRLYQLSPALSEAEILVTHQKSMREIQQIRAQITVRCQSWTPLRPAYGIEIANASLGGGVSLLENIPADATPEWRAAALHVCEILLSLLPHAQRPKIAAQEAVQKIKAQLLASQ
jgi:hypothetical protein